MQSDLPIEPPSQYPSDRDRTGPRPACERLATAALPHAHRPFTAPVHLHELDVRLSRKRRVLFDLRSDAVNVLIGDLIDESDTVRIAHRHACHLQREVADLQGCVLRRVAWKRGRDAIRLQDRLAHVDRDALGFAAIHLQLDCENTPACLDAELLLGGDALIVYIFGDTAQPVAAHLRFGAVGVEHAHASIALLRRADEDEPVAADAEVPIGHCATQGGGVLRRRLAEAVEVDVVVAAALHLRKAHRYSAPDVAPAGGWERMENCWTSRR